MKDNAVIKRAVEARKDDIKGAAKNGKPLGHDFVPQAMHPENCRVDLAAYQMCDMPKWAH